MWLEGSHYLWATLMFKNHTHYSNSTWVVPRWTYSPYLHLPFQWLQGAQLYSVRHVWGWPGSSSLGAILQTCTCRHICCGQHRSLQTVSKWDKNCPSHQCHNHTIYPQQSSSQRHHTFPTDLVTHMVSSHAGSVAIMEPQSVWDLFLIRYPCCLNALDEFKLSHFC